MNNKAFRRNPTVMPDSTISPGNPALLRDSDGRWRDQGAGAPRRTSPGEPLAAAAPPARARSPYGTVARAQRVEPRWRDLQWVDFAVDPVDPVSAAPPAPPAAPAMPEAAEPAPSATPEFGNVLRRFGDTRTSSDATSKAIPGLSQRFTRVAVPRLSPAPAQASESPEPPPQIARLAAMRKSADRASPLMAAPPAAPDREPIVALRLDPAPLRDPPLTRTERPFPASIMTPISTAALPKATLRRRWRTMLRARLVRFDVALRGAYGGVAAATRRLARAAVAPSRRPLAEPAVSAEVETPSSWSATVARLKINLRNLARRVAGKTRQLRRFGLIALAMILIGGAAYGAGALLVGLTRPNIAAAGHPPAAAPTAQTARNAAPPSNASLADPAARAASYMTRAKGGDAVAQYDLAVLYARGDGLVQDYASAASWFRAAAAQGNIVAEYNLGVLYERGLGVAANEGQALNWYRSAADQNHPGAQFNLAFAYASGNGAKQDFAAAARWYQRAAQQGLAPAMVNLAILYEQGNGVDRSLIDAYAWYSAAGERNDTGANQRAGELFEQFDDKDRAGAEGLAATIGAALDETSPPA